MSEDQDSNGEPPESSTTDKEPPAESGAELVAESTATGRSPGTLLLFGWSILGVMALGFVWVLVTGLIARSHLEDTRDELRQLRTAVTTGDLDRAERIEQQMRDNTRQARSLTSGPAWWVASNLPVVGTPLRTARVITAQAAHLGGEVLPGVLRLVRAVDTTARKPLSSFDLSTVQQAAPQLAESAGAARAALRAVTAADDSWLGPIAGARRTMVTALSRLTGELDGADRAARILPPMLGADKPQRYFIGFLNEAEARGGGGVPGSFAIASVTRGRITFEHFGSDIELVGVRAKGVDLGPELTARFGDNDPVGTIQNTNLSPNFAIAGRIWAGMWTAKTGERVDGSIALDPTALSYVLAVTGPAHIDGSTISARNIVELTQREQYVRYPGLDSGANAERKRYLTELASGLSERLIGGSHGLGLARALSRAASERRLMVWHSIPSLERELQAARWAGSLGNERANPYSAFIVNNAAGSKLDYYLDRRMTYRRSSCGAGGSATSTLTLTNTAQRSGLPSYVTFRADSPPAGALPGDNSLLVSYYADLSAKITSMSVDGAPVPVVTQTEGNTILATTTVELKAKASVTVRVTVVEPRATGQVTVLRQPLVRPLALDLGGDKCR